MLWVTQENVQVDRATSAWLITRFIDPHAEFAFVPKGTDATTVTNGTPFHMPNAELRKRDGKGTFEVFLETYGLREKDPVLARLAPIVIVGNRLHGPVNVRGGRLEDALPGDAPPEAAGFMAALYGNRLLAKDDLDQFRRAGELLDALYAALKARLEGRLGTG